MFPVVAFGEVVTFAVAIDIAEPVIIASFKKEVTYFRSRILDAGSRGDAIVKFIFNTHAVLSIHFVGTVVHVALFEGKVGICAFAQQISELWTGLNEELESLLLFSPSQMGENRDLDVVERALIVLCRIGVSVDHGLIIGILDILFPSELRVIHFGINGADGGKVFLANISHGDAARHPAMHALRDRGGEANIAQGVAAIHTNREYAAVLSDLSPCSSGDEREEQEDSLWFLSSYFIVSINN